MKSQTAKALLLTAAIFVVFCVTISAKWHFANAVSSRTELKEIADLAVTLAPDDPQTRFAAAAIYRKTFEPADLDRSLSEYETATSLAPYNYLCWLELGSARSRAGDATGAELALKKALDLAPNYADIQWAYGNALLRSGKADEGFRYIAAAANGNERFMVPAVVTTMEMSGGDVSVVRERISSSPTVNAALAVYLGQQKRYDEAAAAWDMVPADQRTTEIKETGTQLAASFLNAKQYRLAVKILGDLNGSNGEKPAYGKVFDGGFEGGVKLRNAPEFEWQVAEGAEPQIAISQTQKHSGANSLLFAFNTMQTATFRSVSQRVALEPGTTYEFEIFYRSELKTGSTTRWEIANAVDGVTIATTEPVSANSDWAPLKTKFTMPAASDGIIIRLVRDRCPSTVCPISGTLWFDDLSLRKL